ncbi:hypothetical protein FGB62_5g520 [Gracilaria domingensis]|nr:hypothetical protein FGB62_5g520 [Gracilaria domingensis]
MRGMYPTTSVRNLGGTRVGSAGVRRRRRRHSVRGGHRKRDAQDSGWRRGGQSGRAARITGAHDAPSTGGEKTMGKHKPSGHVHRGGRADVQVGRRSEAAAKVQGAVQRAAGAGVRAGSGQLRGGLEGAGVPAAVVGARVAADAGGVVRHRLLPRRAVPPHRAVTAAAAQ